MISREELLKMKNMSFDEVNPEDMIDIDDFHIDVTLSKSEKIKQILESGKNPYFLKLESLASLESKSETEYGNGCNGGW